MEKLKYEIITLGNGNKYFVYDEYVDLSGAYELILNVDEEDDIDIVKQEKINDKIILNEIEDLEKKNELLEIFCELNDEEMA